MVDNYNFCPRIDRFKSLLIECKGCVRFEICGVVPQVIECGRCFCVYSEGEEEEEEDWCVHERSASTAGKKCPESPENICATAPPSLNATQNIHGRHICTARHTKSFKNIHGLTVGHH